MNSYGLLVNGCGLLVYGCWLLASSFGRSAFAQGGYVVGERGVEARLGCRLYGCELGLELGVSGGLGRGLGLRELCLGSGKLGLGFCLGFGYFSAEFRLMRLNAKRIEELEVVRAGYLSLKGRLEARKGRREGGAHGGKP